MKILFLNLTEHSFLGVKHPQHLTPPLDIGYCAAILEKQSYDTEFIDTATKKASIKSLTKIIAKEQFDFVIIKPSLRAIKHVTDLAQSIKKISHAVIILIGPVPSLVPQKFLFKDTPIDFCVIGEPELILPKLVKTVNSKKESNIKGIAFFKKKLILAQQQKYIKNLDKLPFPKHSFFINRGYNFFYPLDVKERKKMGFMLSSRGCPFNCTFCSPMERASYGNEYRGRSAKNVVDEMEFLVSHGVNGIYFMDDLFTFDKKRVEEICEEIVKRKLDVKWAVQSRVGNLSDETLKKMKIAGCSTICLGIESGNERILKQLNKRIELDEIEKTVKEMKRNGINTVGFFIIGNPTETTKEILNTMQFAKKLKLDMIQVHFFTPYPGSASFGNFNPNNVEELNINEMPFSFSSVTEKEKLKFLQNYFYKSIYLSPSYLPRYLKRSATSVFNVDEELKLLKNTFNYFFRPVRYND